MISLLPSMDGNSPIGFGKHIGKQLKAVPDTYFVWLSKQGWFIYSSDSYNNQLRSYIAGRLKKCDMCGLFFTGELFDVVNENFCVQPD